MHQNTDWEKELDKHFPEYFDGAYYEKEDVNLGDELKSFIRSLLQDREEWLLKQVKELPWNGQVVNPEWRDEVLTILTPENK